jgi:hypothetical protein
MTVLVFQHKYNIHSPLHHSSNTIIQGNVCDVEITAPKKITLHSDHSPKVYCTDLPSHNVSTDGHMITSSNYNYSRAQHNTYAIYFWIIHYRTNNGKNSSYSIPYKILMFQFFMLDLMS